MTTKNKPTTKNKFRLSNNLSLGLFTVISCGVALWLAEPAQPFAETISLGTGYASLILLLVTLLIGPLNMLRVRKNPVNINLRRDAGIWSGITALLHVIFSFQVFFEGNLLRYFFNDANGKLTPLFDLFGLSNDVGLVALGIILFLTVISSNYFLRKLKGKLWKNLQRLNYLLAALTLAHTFGQQFSNNRNPALIYGVIGFTLLVLIAQSIGFAVYRQRDGVRKAGAITRPQPAPTNQPQLEPVGNTAAIGRRRFIIAAGAASLASFGVGAALPALLAGKSQAQTVASAEAPDTQAPSPTATATSPATSATSRQRGSRTGTAPGAQATPAAGSASSSSSATAQAASSASQATPTQAASSAATSVTGGTVLATIAKLPASGVQQFWTPDTHKNAFLVRESDGSIKAFSGVCPHRPYDLVYKEDKKQFYCALHSAYFNGQTGSVISGPVRSGLPTISKVQVDKQGNIIYTTV